MTRIHRVSLWLMLAVLPLQASAFLFSKKDSSIEAQKELDAGNGYVGLVVTIGSGKLNDVLEPRLDISYWHKLHLKNLDEDKRFEISPLGSINTNSKVYLGQLPAGRYQLLKLESETFDSENKKIITHAFSERGEFSIASGQLADLQGIAYYATDESIEPDKSFLEKALMLGVRNETSLAFAMPFATDVVKHYAAEKISPDIQTSTVTISNIDSSAETLSTQLPVAVDSSYLAGTEQQLKMLEGRFGTGFIGKKGSAWQTIRLPTFFAVTAIAPLSDNLVLAGTEFGTIFEYDLAQQQVTRQLQTGLKDQIHLLDRISDTEILVIDSRNSNYSVSILDINSWELTPVSESFAEDEIDYDELDQSELKDFVFRLTSDEPQQQYYLAKGIYEFDGGSFERSRKASRVFDFQQGNAVIRSGRRASYNNGKRWENPRKATRINDPNQDRAFIFTSKQLLKPAALYEGFSAERKVVGVEFFNSRNFAKSWESLSRLDQNCDHVLYGISLNDEVYVHCKDGTFKASWDRGKSWEAVDDTP